MIRKLSIDISTVDEILTESPILMTSISDYEAFTFLDSERGNLL